MTEFFDTDIAFRELLKVLGKRLREYGFKGSGQTFRRVNDEVVQVVNFQKSRWKSPGNTTAIFYVNYGVFIISADLHGCLPNVKEYQCHVRLRLNRRIPEDPWGIKDTAEIRPLAEEFAVEFESTALPWFDTLRTELAFLRRYESDGFSAVIAYSERMFFISRSRR